MMKKIKNLISAIKSIKFPKWVSWAIILAPYLILLEFYLYNTGFLVALVFLISYSKEIFLVINTALLIQNGVGLFITKKLFESKSQVEMQRTLRAEEKINDTALLVKNELFFLQNENRKLRKELLKIKQEHIEIKVKIEVFNTLLLKDK